MSLLRWNETDRRNVANMLVQKYRQLGVDRLVAAIRECECKATPLSGWEALADSAEECLHPFGNSVSTDSATRTRVGVG